MKTALKWTVITLAAALFLVLVGADPFLGATQVFRSGIMLGLLVILALLCLWALVMNHFRRPLLGLAHLGCLCMAVGAILDFASEQKVNFGIFVGKENQSKLVYDETKNITLPVGFKYAILDFAVEYYPDTYTLHEVKDRAGVILKGTGKEKEGEGLIRFEEADMDIPSAEMKGQNMKVLADGKHIVMRKGGVEKSYKAQFWIDGETMEFGVNQPISHKGWKFYMMSHGVSEGKQYVRMIARNAPGRLWMITGITLLLVGCTAWCLKPRKQYQ